MFFIHTNLKAEIIKFSSCKFTKEALIKTIHDVLNNQKKEKGEKTTPYNIKKAMAEKMPNMNLSTELSTLRVE